MERAKHPTRRCAVYTQKSSVLVVVPAPLCTAFALPRCWSRGDSNSRSSLWFLALTKGSKFQRGSRRQSRSENCFSDDLPANSGRKRPAFGPFSKGERPKRTGGSNPLCSTNEALRTAGPVCNSSRCGRSDRLAGAPDFAGEAVLMRGKARGFTPTRVGTT